MSWLPLMPAPTRTSSNHYNPYRTCRGCGHVFLTEAELVTSHLQLFVDAAMTPRPEDHHGDSIHICPGCTHDF